MSKYATKEQLISIVQDMASKISVPTIGIGGGYAPIGTIISYMGVTAPQDYLACDGSVYNISAYTDLADFIESQFGSKNYFGGNGTTTFGVPTLTGAPTNTIYCIKAVATGDAYSTSETKTNKVWVDGSVIYRKTIDCGTLPNATSKTINTGITNYDHLVAVYGGASSVDKTSTNGSCPLPRINGDNADIYVVTTNNLESVVITAQTNREYLHGYVTLEYTKTT